MYVQFSVATHTVWDPCGIGARVSQALGLGEVFMREILPQESLLSFSFMCFLWTQQESFILLVGGF